MSSGKQPTKKTNPRDSDQKLNWVQSITYPIRDVLIESLGKGQFIAAGVLLILGIILWRMPETEIVPFFNSLMNRCEGNYIFGWILFVIVVVCWFGHYKFISRTHARELNRALKEKEDLQSKLLERINKEKS